MRPLRLWTILLPLIFASAACCWWLAAHRSVAFSTAQMAMSSAERTGPQQHQQAGPAPSPEPTARPAPAFSDPPAEQIKGKEPDFADILEEVGDLSLPGAREKAVARLRALALGKRAAAQEEAQRLGLPLRVELPNSVVQELVDFENGKPVYFTTHNVNAAISTGANLLQAAPYSLTGTGITIGLWDGGSARATHQEFATGSRVVVQDGAASIDHATHVAGTLAAAGVMASAKGMAPAAVIHSYDWNSDITEMTSRAAASAGQTTTIYLSNHSYGYIAGWNYLGGTGSPARTWEWYGDGTASTNYEYDFGRYNTYSRQDDALAFSAPYYLIFRSAGNDRTDNPANGDTVALSAGSSTVVSYSSASHPAGDGSYRGGFENIAFDALGKNVITIGSISDAVSGGVRSVAAASVSSFSSWGPTDDGRVKPDVVANGDGLYSSLNGSDTSYGTYSGTSMASPNATGTAALLIQQYRQLFTSGDMRASTLKGLLIHTADDLGNAGPDYKYGWGLVNGQAAADLIRDHAAHPLKVRMNEGLITSTSTTATHEFVWDGVSPIRATLSWTDPAGTATSTNDLRTARLVNNLNLKITGPNGTDYQPYVMPFVGTWTQASMDLPATTGVNNVDNVEQVYLAAPPAAGVYRCVVTYSGTLTNSQQNYSLLISGAANEAPPPPPLVVSGVTPTSALPGTVTMALTGTGFKATTAVKLTRSGQADVSASSVTFTNNTSLSAQFNLAGVAAGLWNLQVTNTDGETYTLANAFTVVAALWSETFDGTVTGWASQATTGSNAWTVTTAQSKSPTSSYFAPGPSSKTTCNLTSPAITIPAGASGMQLSFWHSYNLQSTRDAGKLEFSLDEATWFDVTASGSGAAFASNGYNSTVNNTGTASSKNEFAGLQAWSGNSGGFIQTLVNLTDTAKYAGHSLRVRWRIATNSGTASTGWYVDSISLTAEGNQTNQAPAITSTAHTATAETVTDPDSTVYEVVRGQSVGVSAAASDDAGEAALTYTWSSTQNSGVAPSFSANASNVAKNTTVYFEAIGDYVLTATAKDAQGLTAASSVNVRVLPTASTIQVTPGTASVIVGGQQAYTAAELDQFGQPLVQQPTSFAWTLSGGGSISTTGMVTASTAGGPYVVTALANGISGVANLVVNPAPATVILGNLTPLYDGTPKVASVTTTPAGLAVSLTYNGSATPPTAVGSYVVAATVTAANYQGSTTGTLVIRDSYASWTATRGVTSATADPDGDGLPNLMEYALGSDPEQRSPAPAVTIQPDLASTPVNRLTMTFSRPTGLPDVTYHVWASGDLTTWQEVTDISTSAEAGATKETVTVRDSQPASSTGHRFMRLEVRQAP